jgi:hypothetical protein
MLVERRQEDSSVQRVQVDEAVELGVPRLSLYIPLGDFRTGLIGVSRL